MDIDEILARAEVSEGAVSSEGTDELLSSFKVASFADDTADPAFWSKLIPANQRVLTLSAYLYLS